MRSSFVISCVAALLIAAVSFFAGEFLAKQDAERIARLVAASEIAQHRATTFQFTRNALKLLKEKKPGEAEILLTRLAKLQAFALVECSKSEHCRRSAGGQMPDELELAEVTSASWNK